jgi:hypothetical protein
VRRAASQSAAPAAAASTPAATPAAAPLPPGSTGVVRAIAGVERAFNAGNVRRLCRPGALLDPSVVREQSLRPGGCLGEASSLVDATAPWHLVVHSVVMRTYLATATLERASGGTVVVNLVRHGSRWLLGFSWTSDPLPALAGS